jgi:putative transposase
VKLLWLAIRDIEDKRARERVKEAGLPRGRVKEQGMPRDRRKAPHRLVEGGVVQGWNAAHAALTLAFPGRLEAKL